MEMSQENTIIYSSSSFLPLIIMLLIILLIFLYIPSYLKVNSKLFIISFIISALITNFILTYIKILYFDNTWYTQKYVPNNNQIYKKAFDDIIKDSENNLNYYKNATIDAISNALTLENLKENSKIAFSSLVKVIKFVFSPLEKGFICIKNYIVGEPKKNYPNSRKPKKHN